MGVFLADQTIIFLYAIALGAGAGVLYDLFRISRIAIPTPRAIVCIQDIIYFSIIAFSTFILLMTTVGGRVRVFLLAGAFIGAVLYFLTIGQLVIRVAEVIIRIIKAIFRFIYRFILYPVYWILYKISRLILRPIFFFGGIFKKIFKRFKFRLKINRILVYNNFKHHLTRGEKNKDDGKIPHKET